MGDKESEIANRIDMPIVRWENGESRDVRDAVSVEEPLEIFIDDQPFHVTMRTPGEEIPLALGLCFSEGIVDSVDDTLGVNYCRDVSTNRINVYLGPSKKRDALVKIGRKRSAAFSSCGICGKELIEDICCVTERAETKTSVAVSRLIALQDTLSGSQREYHTTGGTHGAAIFDHGGNLLALSEDVGRHNALDKAIGKILFERKRGKAAIVLLTSRLSYEMVQKAARVGAEIVAGASAPTSLAIQLAESVNLTLVGFLRSNRCNVYTYPERIIAG